MAKQIAAKWRESSSLIMLSRDKSLPKKASDYRVLLISRPEKASFMPRSSVFPGGVCEPSDESALWMKYFQNFGVQKQNLLSLTSVQGNRPSIFANHGEGGLLKEISLRITAIRETFEEVGVILCRDKHNFSNSNQFGQFKEDFDRAYWQHKIHNDPAQFLVLCKELEVIPDLWSLHEWSAWLTPSTFKKRFATAFYMVALQETPKLIVERNEVADYAWKSPMEYLTSYLNNEIWLPPPQFYELSRLVNISEMDKLIRFAKERSANGTILILPVQYKCTDGTVSLLPGDDLYPIDPNKATDFIKTGVTMEQFRSMAKKLHRSEYVNLKNAVLHLNFAPLDGQLEPINVNAKSKL